jgi:hypothetical protein
LIDPHHNRSKPAPEGGDGPGRAPERPTYTWNNDPSKQSIQLLDIAEETGLLIDRPLDVGTHHPEDLMVIAAT